jgi:uncharacterized protein (DUF1778 family)
MSTAASNDVPFDFRLPREVKELIEQAAVQAGQSVTDFAVSALVERAEAVLNEPSQTVLTQGDRDIFLRMLNDVDAEPNDALRAAAEDYKQRLP